MSAHTFVTLTGSGSTAPSTVSISQHQLANIANLDSHLLNTLMHVEHLVQLIPGATCTQIPERTQEALGMVNQAQKQLNVIILNLYVSEVYLD